MRHSLDWLGAGLAAALLLVAGASGAEPLSRYSEYEQDTIRIALREVGGEYEPEPAGKTVELIEVVRLDVIERRDPAPRFLNWFHVTTQPFVVRREQMIRAGTVWDPSLVDETARNLRRLRQLSLVLAFPAKGSRPDAVRLIVVTKDVWSLRLNSDVRFAGGRIEALDLQPSEENLFGTHNALSGLFTLDPETYSLGARFTSPRIAGSFVQFRGEAGVILNREEGSAEGSYGSVSYGQPLYTTRTEWAWSGAVAWREELVRRYVGGAVDLFDAEITEAPDDIPFRYRSDVIAGAYRLTRSYGVLLKHDVSVALEASRRAFRTPELTGFDPRAVEEFQRTQLPVDDTRVFPSLNYRTHSTRFVRLLDVNTLALQEDFAIGHDLEAKVYPVTRALGSTRDFAGFAARAGYTVPLGNGIARAYVESSIEAEAERIADGSVEAAARLVSPTLGFGRLVFDARLLHRYRNFLNRRTSIGGEGRLRGYPSQAFLGADVLSYNLELRTRPLDLWSIQVGGVAFYDSGDAFDGFAELDMKQSAGIGLRALIPQLNRIVMRADWGIPLSPGWLVPGRFPGDIVVTFRQAFSMPLSGD